MKIAIDASRAFLHERTGIEEYSYQVIKQLRDPLKDHRVTLYIRGGTRENVDFEMPDMWRVKELRAKKFWTYLRLSWDLLLHRHDRLFVPGHIVPPIHPKRTVVVVHGLEYEVQPDAYSRKERRHMRYGIKRSCRWSKYIICVSNNTKKDLMNLYHVAQKKIRVVYEGVNPPLDVSDLVMIKALKKFHVRKGQYLFFVGRIETRKNIIGILKAYEILREHFHITHKLVLAGKPGHGWEEIADEIERHHYKDDIIVTGFISQQEKWSLLRNAAVFLFPTLYEGFGLPVLEAQQVGVPVVTSNTSSLKEISKDSALLVDPLRPGDIAEKAHMILTDEELYHDIIGKGQENTKRFDWQRTADLTAKVLLAGKAKK